MYEDSYLDAAYEERTDYSLIEDPTECCWCGAPGPLPVNLHYCSEACKRADEERDEARRDLMMRRFGM